MANQITIDIGAAANDGTGDPLRTAFNYVNDNFSNVWNTGLPNSNVQFSDNRILTVNTNANLVLAPNGIAKVVSNVSILPNMSNVHSVGSNDRRWNTIYAQYLDISNDITFNNVTVDGNLTVQGNTIQIGNIVTDTKTIQLANTANTTSAANGSGITVGASDNIATLLYNSTSNAWTTNIGVSVTGNITGNYFIGNGALLTGITAGSNYSNANVAAYLPTYSGNISAGNVSVTNAISAHDVYADAGTFAGDPVTGDGSLYVGAPNFVPLGTDVMAQFTGNVTTYAQLNLQNYGNSNTASGDYIITADNGTDSSYFLNLGLTGSNWDGSQTNSLGNSLVPNNGYLYVQDGNLTLGVRNGNTSYTWNFDTTGRLTAPGDVYGQYFTVRGGGFPGDVIGSLGYSGNVISVFGSEGVVIEAVGDGGPQWQFGTTGNLTVPGIIQGSADSDYVLKLGAFPEEVDAGRYLQVRSGDVADHIHFDTSNNSAWNFYVGSDNQYVLLGNTGNVSIASYDSGNSITYGWTFDTTGNLNLPNNGSINFNAGGITQATDEDFYITVNDADDDGFAIFNRITDTDGNNVSRTELQRDRFNINLDMLGVDCQWQFSDFNGGTLTLPGNIQGIYGGSTSFYAVDNGSGGLVEMKTISYAGDALGSNVRVTQSNATISTSSATYTWTFDNTGNLTVPGNTIVSTANAIGNVGGKSITIQAGAADQSDYYATPGGNVNITGGLGATNDGGGGGQGGSINLTAGLSADPAGVAGNVNINTGSNTWTYSYNGELWLPGGTGYISSSANNITMYSDAGEFNGINCYPTGVDVYAINDFAIFTDNANTGNTWRFYGNAFTQMPGSTYAIGNISVSEGTFRNGDPPTSYVKPQITFGYGNTNDYAQYIHTRHNTGGLKANNAIDFYTSDGTSSGTFPANAILGGSITQGAMQLAVYANATVRDSTITSPAAGMMIYVTGTGMQVYGATQWNTIAGSGT
jgi:hypothetical protein